MNLRKLELAGFKTFARRTEVPLPGGVTAIVGPNGSGKSNLADALRWVLGEQSLQHIRSKKTEDVIFAGSGSRNAMGLAEVVLTLDNTSGWIPLDFSEVTLTRRAHRSGENEYFINGARVRLRDVVDLRNRAGFGQSSYSVIGQGLIDQVLSQRPDERRALFEEAAGIRHYQSKRDHALEQLATTQQNLLRVNDIIAEIAPRLASLRHQSEKARQFERLNEELRTLQVRWYAAKHRQLGAQVGDAERQLAEAEAQLQRAAGRVRDLEAAAARLENERQVAERSLAEQSQRAAELGRQRQHVQGQISLAADKLKFMEQQGDDIEREIAEIAQSRASSEREQAQLVDQLRELRASRGVLEERLKEAEQQSLQRIAGLRQAERRAQEAREELIQATATLGQRQQEATELSRRKAELSAQAQEHAAGIRAKTGLIAGLKERTDKLQELLQGLRGQEERLSGELEQARLQVAAAAQDAASKQKGLETIGRRLHEAKTRLQLMQELQANLEGFGEGVKTVAKSGHRGVLGPLAEQLRVKEGYERAIGAALGFKLQAVLVADDAAVLDLMGLLSKSGGSLVPGPWAPAQPRAIPAGLVAAQEVVDSGHPAVARLLADVAIAPDLGTALQHRQGTLRIATVSGEIVDLDGTVTRHSTSAAEAVLKRQRQLEELAADVARIDAEISAGQAELAGLEQVAAACRGHLTQLEQQHRDLSQRRQQHLSEVRDLSQQQQAAQAQIEWMASLKKQVEGDLGTLDLRQTTLIAEIDQWSERVPELRQAAQLREQELAALQEASQAESEQPGHVRVEIGVTQQRIEHVGSLLRGVEQSLANSERQLEARQRRSAERLQTLNQLRAEIEGHHAQLTGVERQFKEQESGLQPLRNRLETLAGELAGVRSQEAEAREDQVEQDKLCYRFGFEAQRKRDEIESLAASLMDELQLTLDLLPAPPPDAPEPSKREVDALKSRIAALGPVNPGALAEFEEVNGRHEFLTTQAADLEQAAIQLHGVIGELEELTERQFRETFLAIEVEFERYFKTMFHGGQVQLFLTQPDQVTSSGVEIMAQPPGKRLQSLAALSGGERALVAASLLFAILTVRPVPFCLLDEVDAALDEANVGRFCRALKSLAEQTQFILITHNRETMAMADALYGVSMTEDGVSRLLSLRLARDGDERQ